jgi:hypothetical protein
MTWMITPSRLAGPLVLCAAIVFGLGAADALGSQGRGRGSDAPPAKAAKKGEARAAAVDRDGHVRAIRAYARDAALPPGLAKRETLPPGLRQQLRERGELPPGLQEHLVVVPAPLVARLPPVPRHYERYFVEDDLIVVDTRTKHIVAILPNVWN